MRKHFPCSRQQAFDFEHLSRGDKLMILGDCQLRGEDIPRRRKRNKSENCRRKTELAVLRKIDDHIGKGGDWTLSRQQLAVECDMPYTTLCDALQWLDHLGAISITKRRVEVVRLKINWSVIGPLSESFRRKYSFDDSFEGSDNRNLIPTDGNDFQLPESDSNYRNQIPIVGIDYITAQRTAPSSSSSSSQPANDNHPVDLVTMRRKILEELLELGVNYPDAALEQSLKLRSLDETLEIIRYWAREFRLPNGMVDRANGPGKLVDRLRNPGAKSNPADKGWNPSDEAFRRTRNELREMHAAQRQLIDGWLPPTEDEIQECLETWIKHKARRLHHVDAVE